MKKQCKKRNKKNIVTTSYCKFYWNYEHIGNQPTETAATIIPLQKPENDY